MMERRLRIVTGLILFAFVTCHLVNASLGLGSIELMDRARIVLLAPWSNLVGNLTLAIAILVHGILGLKAIYGRNTLRMARQDIVQVLSSLVILPLLVPHVVGTAVAARLGIEPSYRGLIPFFWIEAPLEGLRQVLLLTILWIHGCIGVYTWARVQPWWRRLGNWLYPLAVAIPVLALLGFVEAGNQAIEALSNPAPVAAQAVPPAASTAPPVATQRSLTETLALLKRINWVVIYAYLGLVAAAFGARWWRLRDRRGRIRVRFMDGPTFEADAGVTVLEAAHRNHAPIANLCRGRARCGTCRVRILQADGHLPPPDVIERETLARFGGEPDVRLACQLRPGLGELVLERLVPPHLRARDLHVLFPGGKARPTATQEEAA